MFLLIKFWQKGYTMKKKPDHPHLLVLDVLLLKPMQDLLLQPETKEKKLKKPWKLHVSYILIFSISLLSKLTELF